MASESMMSKAIAKAVAEATRVALQTMVEAQMQRTQNAAGPKLCSPALKQLTFNSEVSDKYTELKTFRLEVNSVLSTYSMPEAEKLAVVKNWLRRKGLHYLDTLTLAEREACTTLDGLFDMLAIKLKLQYNKTINSLQCRKLVWLESKNVEEWMGKLHVVAVECNYREVDRQLKEQFIHGLNDKYMFKEIIKELTITKDDDWITSESVLA